MIYLLFQNKVIEGHCIWILTVHNRVVEESGTNISRLKRVSHMPAKVDFKLLPICITNIVPESTPTDRLDILVAQ